jgi:hypothetical protein
MGKGRKRTTQKMKNRSNQRKKKSRMKKVVEARKQAKRR